MSTEPTLTLADISDLRAYERERAEFRPYIIALKKKRRVHLGPIMTLLFENRQTIRFQIQEMARIEKIATDQGIETELRTYNPLISRPGKLSATLFIELTSDEQLREWLPRLTGAERHLKLHLGRGDDAEIIEARPDSSHGEALGRDHMTSAVHYLWWPISPAQVDRFEAGPARIVCTHPDYLEEMALTDENRASIAADLR